MFKLQQSFKEVKGLNIEQINYDLHSTLDLKISKKQILQMCECPENEEYNNWLLLQCNQFLLFTEQLFEACGDFCILQYCPHMLIGNVQYFWKENKEQIHLSAREYCDRALRYVISIIQQCDNY